MPPPIADYAWLRRAPGRPPLIVAHRGASGLAPENTLAAFRLALDLGAPAVECDVHLAADGAPVVIHDPRVDRTTSGSGDVRALTLDHLRRLDAGSWFSARFAAERIPTLDETLAVCTGRARVFVELKVGGGPPLVDAALQAIA
ncbi:MAG: glycerophosphodiester phosphodiesterase, partial [Chloroflexota bacterium]